jgi:hypothetical protein
MVVTMVEARVPVEREGDLIEAYGGGTEGELPPSIVETFLLHAVEGDVWRIATMWRSREELDAYRASVETPAAIEMFRAAGVEPAVTVFDVVRRMQQAGS